MCAQPLKHGGNNNSLSSGLVYDKFAPTSYIGGMQDLSKCVNPQVEELHGIGSVVDLHKQPDGGLAHHDVVVILLRFLLQKLGLRELGLLLERLAVLDQLFHNLLTGHSLLSHVNDLLLGQFLRVHFIFEVSIVLT